MTSSTGSAWLIALLLLPLLGGVAVAGIRAERTAKLTALVVSLAQVVLAAGAWLHYNPHGTRLQLVSSADWIPSLGVHISFGVDGIALVMIAITSVLMPIVIGGSWSERLPEGRTASGFFSLLLILQALVTGVFA
ncbi:MAG: NADH-quinone oxidoreductase subunit M, partial [Sciscionella sp.]